MMGKSNRERANVHYLRTALVWVSTGTHDKVEKMKIALMQARGQLHVTATAAAEQRTAVTDAPLLQEFQPEMTSAT